MDLQKVKGYLILEDGSIFEGTVFGHPKSISGEVVFNTGMVGCPEALTDPSYCGQILVLTYPLIGNYGVLDDRKEREGLSSLESESIKIQGLVVSDYSFHFNHWNAGKSLDAWLREYEVPALTGIDTRRLTKRLRQHGSMLGKILIQDDNLEFYDPNRENLVDRVSSQEPMD